MTRKSSCVTAAYPVHRVLCPEGVGLDVPCPSPVEGGRATPVLVLTKGGGTFVLDTPPSPIQDQDRVPPPFPLQGTCYQRLGHPPAHPLPQPTLLPHPLPEKDLVPETNDRPASRGIPLPNGWTNKVKTLPFLLRTRAVKQEHQCSGVSI